MKFFNNYSNAKMYIIIIQKTISACSLSSEDYAYKITCFRTLSIKNKRNLIVFEKSMDQTTIILLTFKSTHFFRPFEIMFNSMKGNIHFLMYFSLMNEHCQTSNVNNVKHFEVRPQSSCNTFL